MAEHAEESTVKPEVLLLEQLLDEVAAGRLRVPRFQRPFVWRPDQMLDLYDSIERSYPIGSLLVWETPRKLPSLDQVAGLDIPPHPTDGTVAYLLDGHQRLSTLFGTLTSRPAPADTAGEQTWRIYRDLDRVDDREPRFQHWSGPGEPPARLLPTQAVLRTMEFLAHARRLAREVEDPAECDALVEAAEQLAQRIRSYKIAVVRLIGGDLSHAVEAFARLNSAGQQITPDQMVSALTWREGGTSLADRITTIRESLADGGIGEIPPGVVFQTVLAIAGEEDVQAARWAALADRLKDDLDTAAQAAEPALHRAVRFLRYEIGVPTVHLVPYPSQLVLLATYYHLVPEPDGAQTRELVRLFWATSWSGLLAGSGDFQIRRALRQVRDFAHGAELDLQEHRARPMPDWFDADDGRVRAFILWESQTFNGRLGLDNTPIEIEALLARSGAAAYRRMVTGIPEESWPANRIVLPSGSGLPTLKELLQVPPRRLPKLIVSHGISGSALAHLLAGDGRAFVRRRARDLTRWEREFMEEMGITPGFDYDWLED